MMKKFSYLTILLLAALSKLHGQENDLLDLINNNIDFELTNQDIFNTSISNTNSITNSDDIPVPNTALFDAVIENDTLLVVELIKEKIDVNARDDSYKTPIMYTTDESIEIADLLITHGAYLNTRDSYGNTILMIASEKGYTKLVSYLLDYATLINANNREGFSALHFAIQNGHTEIVELLIKHRANIYDPMPNGMSPIFEAAQKGYTRIVDLLLKKGINPNSKILKTGTSLLGIASAYGSLSMVQTLISHGATLDLPNKVGITPIFLAAAKGHFEIVEYLLQQDSTISIETDTGIKIEDVIVANDRKTLNIIKKYKK